MSFDGFKTLFNAISAKFEGLISREEAVQTFQTKAEAFSGKYNDLRGIPATPQKLQSALDTKGLGWVQKYNRLDNNTNIISWDGDTSDKTIIEIPYSDNITRSLVKVSDEHYIYLNDLYSDENRYKAYYLGDYAYVYGSKITNTRNNGYNKSILSTAFLTKDNAVYVNDDWNNGYILINLTTDDDNYRGDIDILILQQGSVTIQDVVINEPGVYFSYVEDQYNDSYYTSSLEFYKIYPIEQAYFSPARQSGGSTEVPLTTSLLKGDGEGGILEATIEDIPLPTLAKVATSGSYDDLTEKPIIPDVSVLNNAVVNNGIGWIESFDIGLSWDGNFDDKESVLISSDQYYVRVGDVPTPIDDSAIPLAINVTEKHFDGLKWRSRELELTPVRDNGIIKYSNSEYSANFILIFLPGTYTLKNTELTFEHSGIYSYYYKALYNGSFIGSIPYIKALHAIDAKYLIPNLSAVAQSNDYNDLDNTPNFSDVATSGNYEDLTGKPELAKVATSGSYDDLSDKPETEEWIITLGDGSRITKEIYVR